MAEADPPFPDIPIADVPVFSLSRLVSDDESHAEELFEKCCSLGFFLLDLTATETGEDVLRELRTLSRMSKDFFALDASQKRIYAQDAAKGNFTGWKDVGIMKTEKNAPDRCEFYAILQDDILGNIPARPHPSIIERQRPTTSSFILNTHKIIKLILSILEARLQLPKGTLASLVRTDDRSGSLLRLFRYAPQPRQDRRTSLLAHTDMGVITFLYSTLGGLQILPPGGQMFDDSAWQYVCPKPDCAIINLGDALVEWSGGILRSNLHRVTYAPGEQNDYTRYSMAYLVRGNRGISMKRLQSKVISTAEETGEEDMDVRCEEWELSKNKALTAGADCARSRGGRMMRQA